LSGNNPSSKTETTIAPYGSWSSPISAKSVGSGAHVYELKLLGDQVYFVEVRPREANARYSLMKVGTKGANATEITPPPFSVRSMVYEYGGAAFLTTGDSVVFSNFDDQRLYKQSVQANQTPRPLTREGVDGRYADGVFDSVRNRIICVRELHPEAGKRDADLKIVEVDLESGTEKVLLSGNDFYAYPRLSLDCSRLAWITWNFPNMPFDGSELWTGEFDSEGSLRNKTKLAGGLDESVTQPRWSDGGDLYFISDRTGWWNIYRWSQRSDISAVCPKNSDFCHPDWNLGLSTYSLGPDDKIICTFAEDGQWSLAVIESSKLERIDTPFKEINHVQASGRSAVFLAASLTEGNAIFSFDFDSKKVQKIYEPPGEENGEKFPASVPLHITFPTTNNLEAHGFFYGPLNPEYKGPQNEVPPLVVMAHGGPTHASTNAFRDMIQYFTSRGFAVMDVNYGGSSAYGREYRRRLNGQWGVVDVNDCVNGALNLAKQGKIDGKRVVIRGGSAGGWTTLAALAFSDFFKAGACHFGISDLERWELDCHKFESQYLHSLIGSYPQEKELFIDRSPTTHAGNVSAPLIIFQGLEDRVVPPSQSELMVEAMRKKNKSVEYVQFEGEQHGFRQARHIEEAMNRELEFFKTALKIP